MPLFQFLFLTIRLKAGGVALNLTEASRVFLMDPWWNPGDVIVAVGMDCSLQFSLRNNDAVYLKILGHVE